MGKRVAIFLGDCELMSMPLSQPLVFKYSTNIGDLTYVNVRVIDRDLTSFTGILNITSHEIHLNYFN